MSLVFLFGPGADKKFPVRMWKLFPLLTEKSFIKIVFLVYFKVHFKSQIRLRPSFVY